MVNSGFREKSSAKRWKDGELDAFCDRLSRMGINEESTYEKFNSVLHSGKFKCILSERSYGALANQLRTDAGNRGHHRKDGRNRPGKGHRFRMTHECITHVRRYLYRLQREKRRLDNGPAVPGGATMIDYEREVMRELVKSLQMAVRAHGDPCGDGIECRTLVEYRDTLAKADKLLRAASDEENGCEHGDHPAPTGKRFCSDVCKQCEMTNVLAGKDCAGLCVSETPARPDWEAVALAFKNVLHRISLGSQNSMTTKEDLGREARIALAAYDAAKGAT